MGGGCDSWVGPGRGFHFKGEWLRKELAYRQAQLTAAYRDWPLPRLIEAQVPETLSWDSQPFWCIATGPSFFRTFLDSK